jgi:hypothetical protein
VEEEVDIGKQVRERGGFFVAMPATVSKLEDSIDTLANPNADREALKACAAVRNT